ncbi:MAG: hypothetical protein ABIH82_00425 [Candidatus Woesearchaeota archaeon]
MNTKQTSELEHSVRKIVDFLYNQQIIAEDVVLKPARIVSDAPKNYFGESSFKTKIIRGLSDEFEFSVYFCNLEGKIGVMIGAGRDISSFAGPFFSGDFFRIDTEGKINQRLNESSVDSAGMASNAISLLKTFPKKIKNIPKAKHKGTVLAIMGSTLVKEFFYKYARQKKNKNMQKVAGITFRIAELNCEKLCLESYDQGGIYDFYLNTEGNAYPPQNPADYYADAYAAVCFGELFKKTWDQRYLEAGLLCLDFISRTYNNYQASSLVWYHRDFKNPAFIEAVENIYFNHLSSEKLQAYRNLIQKMESDYYSATNVFALRYHWMSARNHFFKRNDKVKKFLQKLEEDQLKDGLIQDNNYGALYFDSYDLTYHQYALACLARGLEYDQDAKSRKKAEKIFLRGALFSLNLLTPDGEVSYYGRGANNVYHLASGVYAFMKAAQMVKDEKLASQFVLGAEKILSYLLPYQQTNGMFATALNEEIAERYGWNHCATPYNAQSAYFLIDALKLLDQVKDNEDGNNNDSKNGLPFEKRGLVYFKPSGYMTVNTGNYYVVMFRGSPPSYGWSDNKHQVGIGGMCMLGISGKGSLLPIQDLSLNQDNKVALTTSYYSSFEEVFNGNLELFEGRIPLVLHSYAEKKQWYLFFDNFILMIYQGEGKIGNSVFNFPARADGAWKVDDSVDNRGKVICRSDDCGFFVQSIFSKLNYKASWQEKEVSNPRGKAKLIEFGELSESGEQLAVHVIVPFKDQMKEVNFSSSFENDLLKINIGKVIVQCSFNGKPEIIDV